MELLHKNKVSGRKIAELEDKLNDLTRTNESLNAENS
jgi:hypothetical protein